MVGAPGGEATSILRREWFGLAVLLAVGLAVRLVFLADWAATPLFHHPVGDAGHFHRTALALIGQGDEPAVFLYQPLYTFFLAACYLVLGPDPSLVRTLQLVIGLVNVGLVYGLGREIGGRAVAWPAAALAALYGPLVFFEGQLLAPAIVVPLLTGSLWCLVRAGRHRRAWLLLPAGVLMGLVLMGRPNLGILLPVAALWWWRRRRGPRSAIGLGLAALGLVVGLAPSWINNLMAGHGLVPVSSAAGHSFFIGNNPQAPGRFHIPVAMPIDDTGHGRYRQSWQELAERAAGRELSWPEVSSYWLDRGLAFWAEQPGRALALTGRKLLLVVNGEEMPIHHPYWVGQRVAPILGWLPGFAVVLPFALLGLVLGARWRPGVALLGWCAGLGLLTMVAFYVADRYRTGVMPMLWVLAAVGMVALVQRVRRAGLKAGCWPLLVLGLAFAVTQVPLLGPVHKARGLAQTFNRMGAIAAEHEDYAAAQRYFARAVRLGGPRHGALAAANLGLLMERLGRPERAEALYRRAAAGDPGSPVAPRRMARLLQRQGRAAEAAEWRSRARALSPEGHRPSPP